MKWMKLFEGYSDKYYQEITEEEWELFEEELDCYNDNPKSYKPFVDFPENLFLKLRSRSIGQKLSRWYLTTDILADSGPNIWKYKHESSFNSKHTGILWINGIKTYNYNYVKVWMLDDEWFMVSWEEMAPDISGQGVGYLDKHLYFKCDQFEGLVQLLKVKGIIE